MRLTLGSIDEANAAIDACKEAGTQLDVEDSQLARDLAVEVAGGNVEIAFAVAAVTAAEVGAGEPFTSEDAAALDAGLLDRATRIETMLG